MSQNSILLEKSLHFSVRIVKLHRLLTAAASAAN